MYQRLAAGDAVKSLRGAEKEEAGRAAWGPLYRQRVFVDALLAQEEEIVFNGGTHTDAIWMRYGDFAELARPIVGRFAVRPFVIV